MGKLYEVVVTGEVAAVTVAKMLICPTQRLLTVSQLKEVVPTPPVLQDWTSIVFGPVIVAASIRLTVLITEVPLLFKNKNWDCPVHVEKIIVFPLVKVLPLIPKVTLRLEIEAIQLTPGLAIPVPVTVMPAKRPVTLTSWTVAPLPLAATVWLIGAAHAVAGVIGP